MDTQVPIRGDVPPSGTPSFLGRAAVMILVTSTRTVVTVQRVGARTHNGANRYIPRRPILENYFSRMRLTRQEITGARLWGSFNASGVCTRGKHMRGSDSQWR